MQCYLSLKSLCQTECKLQQMKINGILFTGSFMDVKHAHTGFSCSGEGSHLN